MADSSGDPRVLFAMNLVLSSVFAAIAVYAASIVGVWPFGLVRVAGLATVLTLLTHAVVVR